VFVRLTEIFRFEIRYRLRHTSTWIYGGLLIGLPFAMMHAIDGGTGYMNAPSNVAGITIILGMLGMLVSAALFGDAATRDDQWRMRPLFYTAPLSRLDYLGGRFLGALLINTLLLTGVPLGLLLAARMPYMPAGMFGPFQPAAYLQPYLLFLLPNLLLAGAILFAIAVLSRRMLPAYLGAIGLFAGHLLASALHDRISNRAVAAILDPFGITALEDLTRHWTPVELNSRLIGVPEILLWNRLLWVAFTIAVLVVLHSLFRFACPSGGGRRGERQATEPRLERHEPIAVPSVPRAFGIRTRAWQTLAVTRRSLGEIVGSRVFLILAAGALVFVFAFGWDVGGVVFGTSTWPVTHLVAGTVLSGTVSLLVAVLIALFAGEMVWSEREVRLSEITDVAPVPDWVPWAGRFLALVAMLVLLQTVLMGAGVLLQALQGYHRFELGLYMRILFGLKLTDYVLFAALAMVVHVIVDQKYVGHLVVVLYYVFTIVAARFGVHHNLLIYGSDPGLVYSDMNGFGPFLAPFVWFKLYWAAWALLFAVIAILFWPRGRELTAGRRIGIARTRLSGLVARVTAVAAMLILTLGGFIFYNTNVLNEYSTPREAVATRAEYERRYQRFEDVPQPTLSRVEIRVEIHPEERAVDLRGTYHLVNRASQAIDSIHLIIHPDVRARSLSFDRPAERVLADERVRYQVYALERALQPGDSLRLVFDLGFRPRGFPNSGIKTAVARNGAYFDRRWLPIIGYQPALELSDDEERRQHGLGPRDPRPSPDDQEERRYRFDLRDADLVHVEAVVGTDANQIAVTPGTLLREWRENGRRYFHYRTEAPLSFDAPFLSAEYAVREDRWREVALRIFHHPTHTFNLDRMLGSMEAALSYYSEHFGPYQFDELRIVEFPRYGSFARAHPQTIAYSEGSSFLTRVEEGDVDRPFFVTAHETAHQWWGGQVMGARVPGAALLTETLAQYSAMMVMEKTYGPDQVRRLYDYEMDNYLRGRRVFSNREVPLLEVEDQSYLHYHKGAVAMYTLREHIGEERMNAALRRYLEKHRSAGPPYPTSRDLYAELRAVTPDSLHYLLRDLFEEITLWNVRADRARAEPTAAGEYRVTLEVEAVKVRADSTGSETEVPMDDLVEIGVFAPATGGSVGEPLYLRRHRIQNGRQTITVTVGRQPARAGIDPYRKLIARDARDNLVDVEAPTSESMFFGITGSGSINVSTAAGPVNARTGSGSIDIRMLALRASDDMEFTTGSGQITLRLPRDFHGEIDARTGNGRINTDFPLTVQGSMGRGSLRGTIGEGGRRIRLASGSGGIALRLAD
jgi:ABC-2 type transport system permease protein